MTEKLRRVQVKTQSPDFPVHAEAVHIGPDVLVFIWGGERPHIGAVAAAQPRASLAEEDTRSATASVLTFLGHKEDEVVKYASERLAAALNTHVVVTAGIHWDDLTPEAIRCIRERCREVVHLLIEKLATNNSRPGD